MCVLTHDEITRELRTGRLRIEPLDPDQIGPASIDLHLGREFRGAHRAPNGLLHVSDSDSPRLGSSSIEVDDYYVLDPGQTVLGITRERLFFPSDLCAWIEGRSCIARFGLTVHASSGFIQPGASNRQVLEMSNMSGVPLALHPGTRICQIVLERTIGQAVYTGRFATQVGP